MGAADTAQSRLEARAACLINPESGIANDYLNVYNEVLLLIENLPVLLPEMIDELEQWKPVTYREYFTRSPLPGSAKALAVYESLDASFREEFEERVAVVAEIAVRGIGIVLATHAVSGEVEPEALSQSCGALAKSLRDALMDATDLVNTGRSAHASMAQAVADELMSQSR